MDIKKENQAASQEKSKLQYKTRSARFQNGILKYPHELFTKSDRVNLRLFYLPSSIKQISEEYLNLTSNQLRIENEKNFRKKGFK
jgi:hypothetical protein